MRPRLQANVAGHVLSWMAVFGFTVAVLVPLPAAAHEGVTEEYPPKVSAAALFKPTSMPDRVVLTWSGDPTTTQAVTWRTSTEISRGFAEIAVADHGPQFVKQAQRLTAVTRPYKSDLSESHQHCVEFTDLRPATRYAYRVGDGANWSEWFQFRTASDKPEPFSFVYFGDSQNDVRSMWSRVIREAFVDAPRAAFMLHAGDLVGVGERDADWGEWFSAGTWINAMIPVVATPGNHEYMSAKEADGKTRRWLTRHWAMQFKHPSHGPEGLEDSVYYVDYQNLRVISLNSNERTEEQVPWLERVLSERQNVWQAVTFHHPIYSMARDRDNAALRTLWKPIFDRYQVDLVLTGHDHCYGRTGLLVPEQNATTGTNWRSSPTGTVYVVSVSGPKMYNLGAPPLTEVKRSAEDTQLYQIISIDGLTLRYEARTALGEVYDAFTLNKRPGQPNEMVEQIPDSVERRRTAE